MFPWLLRFRCSLQPISASFPAWYTSSILTSSLPPARLLYPDPSPNLDMKTFLDPQVSALMSLSQGHSCRLPLPPFARLGLCDTHHSSGACRKDTWLPKAHLPGVARLYTPGPPRRPGSAQLPVCSPHSPRQRTWRAHSPWT